MALVLLLRPGPDMISKLAPILWSLGSHGFCKSKNVMSFGRAHLRTFLLNKAQIPLMPSAAPYRQSHDKLASTHGIGSASFPAGQAHHNWEIDD